MMDSEKVREFGNQGLRALNEDRPDEAFELFTSGLNLAPTNADLLYGRALSCVRTAKFRQGILDIISFLRIRPNHSRAFNILEDLVQGELASTLKAKNIVKSDTIVFLKDYFKEHPERVSVIEVPCFEVDPSRGALRIYKLKDALLLGRFCVTPTPEGNFIQESIFYSAYKEAIAGIPGGGWNDNVRRLPGKFVSLAAYWQEGFWHFMMECVPRVILCEAAGFDGYYIVHPGRSYIYEALEILGIEGSRVLDWDSENASVEELWAPELMSVGHFWKFPGILDAFRENFLRVCSPDNQTSHNDRIYLAREDEKKGRRVLNQDELWAVLERFNFRKVLMEELTLREQISTISKASCLVAPHGAGLFHTLFMKPQSLVIELFNSYFVNPHMQDVYKRLRHRYFMVTGNAPLSREAERNDIYADVELIESTLERELGSSLPPS